MGSRTVKLVVFFVLYGVSILVETILFSYILSAYYSIERQFQIPEKPKRSSSLVITRNVGFLVSALVLSYFGSRGNRMRWIGAAGVLMTLGCVLVAIPNFAFQKHEIAPNASVVRDFLNSPEYQKYRNATPEELLDFPLVKARLPAAYRKVLMDKLHPEQAANPFGMGDDYGDYGGDDQYYYDEDEEDSSVKKRRVKRDGPPHPAVEKAMIRQAFKDVIDVGVDMMFGDADIHDFFEVVRGKIVQPPEVLIGMVNRGAGYGFGPCNSIVNNLKPVVQQLKCENTDTEVGAYVLVVIGLLAIGLGHALPWVLGLPLIDDNFSKRVAPICFGILFWFQTVGPVLAMLIGSAFCRKNYFTLIRPNLSAIDPRWIGAWWLGFLVIGAVLLIPSVIIFWLLGRPTKNAKEAAQSPQSIALLDKYNTKDSVKNTLASDIRGYGRGLVKILRSRIYVSTLIARIFDILSLGAIVYLRKYADMEFGLNEKKATLVLALLGMAGFGVGSIIGGILIGRLRLERRKIALWVVICSLLIGLLFFSRLLVRCHSPVDALNDEGRKNGFNFSSGCNSECACEKVDTFPVCDEAGVPYYSPCVAGCMDMVVIDKANFKVNFTKCMCLENPGNLSSTTVSRDLCKNGCRGPFVGFRAVAVIGGFLAGLAVVPAFLILLRSVPPECRSLAIGFKGFLLMLLGAIPAVYIFSAVTAESCLVWKPDCAGSLTCKVYDTEELRLRINIWAGAFRILATVFDVFVWLWAGELKIFSPNQYEPGEEMESVQNGANDVVLLDAKKVAYDDED